MKHDIHTTYSNFTENNEYNNALREQFLVVRIMTPLMCLRKKKNYNRGPDHSNIIYTKSCFRQQLIINNIKKVAVNKIFEPTKVLPRI